MQFQINELNDKLIKTQKQHEIDIKNLIAKNESDKLEIIRKNEINIKNLTQKFDEDIKKLIEKNEKNKSDLILSFKNELKNLQLKQEKEISDLKKSNDTLSKKVIENDKLVKTKEKEKNVIDCNFKKDQLCGIISYLNEKFGDDLEKKYVIAQDLMM